MVRRHISDELKEMALSMSLQGLHDLDIREFTGISERSLKQFRSTYCRTENVIPPPLIDRGRPHILSAIQVKVRIQHLSPTHISQHAVSLQFRCAPARRCAC